MTDPQRVPPLTSADPDPMRMNYRPMSDSEKEKLAKTKLSYQALWDILDDMGSSRELSTAKTYLETSCMWMTKHLTR